jgi:hypothetical protein
MKNDKIYFMQKEFFILCIECKRLFTRLFYEDLFSADDGLFIKNLGNPIE